MLVLWFAGLLLCSAVHAGRRFTLEDQELIRLMSQSPVSTRSESPRPLSAGVCDEVRRSSKTLSLAEYALGINGRDDKATEDYLSEREESTQRASSSGVDELQGLAERSFQRKRNVKKKEEADTVRNEERRREAVLELHRATEANPLLGWSFLALRWCPCFGSMQESGD
jgi:hypothetical protein